MARRSGANDDGTRLHPWPVRIMHWTNALAMLVMIGSGWGIYNDSVIFNGLRVRFLLHLLTETVGTRHVLTLKPSTIAP